MKNIKLTLSYDGTNYLGWQDSLQGPSIESSLKRALQKILNQDITLQAASRTDAGVHAKAQVVNFFIENDISPETLAYKLNCLLSNDIAIEQAEITNSSFHPTFNSSGKIYSYQLSNQPFISPFLRHLCWHYPYQKLDFSLMQKAASKLVGCFDFSGFSNVCQDPKTNTICNIHSLTLSNRSNLIVFEIQGDRFLYKMVRNLVGTLVCIGASKLPLSIIDQILSTKDRSLAGITAPAQGLFLEKVLY